jgi:thiol-disulfide isomerase/thioredoxin
MISNLNLRFMQNLHGSANLNLRTHKERVSERKAVETLNMSTDFQQSSCDASHYAQPSQSGPPAKVEGVQNVEGDFDKANTAVVVHTPWCGYSKKLMTELPAIAHALRAKGMRTVAMDAEKNQYTRDFAAKHGVEGFPHTLVFDKNGRLRKEISGYRPAAEFVQACA